jgi:nicotinamide-nucleotide amidase
LVTYSNEAKKELLQVTAIEKNGAVSEQTALAMAEGALKCSRADISISITGIAGPEGGTIDKPVGTIWFACSSSAFSAKTSLKNFVGNRADVRLQSIEFALTFILQILEIL